MGVVVVMTAPNRSPFGDIHSLHLTNKSNVIPLYKASDKATAVIKLNRRKIKEDT
jgi:hypothetical protein